MQPPDALVTRRVAAGPKAIVFDHDGTILDTESAEFEAVRRVFADHGLVYTVDQWAHVVGTIAADPWMDDLQDALGTRLDRQAVQETARTYNRQALETVDARPGIRSLVIAARAAGWRLAIASNAPTWWIERRIAPLGLLDSFHHLHGVDKASYPKPHPAPFVEACEMLGIEPADAIAIEDSTTGVASALAAGCFTVACPGPMTLGHDVAAAHLVVESHVELSVQSLTARWSAWRQGPPGRPDDPIV